MSLVSRTALTLLAGLVAVPMTPVTHTSPNAPAADVPVAYSTSQKEAYLAPEALTYIRPGLNVKIVSVTNVAPGQSPTVEILMTDDLGAPLDRTGVLTPGLITAEFVLAQWDPTNYDYVNLTVAFGFPLHDFGGTWTDLAVGDSKYTFTKKLPADFDVSKTLTLGIYSGRATMDIVGKDYNAPAALKTFRADGGTATPVFAAIDTASCNRCHDPISMHENFGPPVQDVRLCVMCHTSQMPRTAAGEPLFFKALIHRIHSSKNVDHGPLTYPQDIRFCTTCHTPTAADGANWTTRPTIAACGSCHDDLNFTTGANHPAGPAADGTCATCHQPQGNVEWDAGIKNAHVVPLKSAQLKGYNASIISVTNAVPGQKPVVTFKLANGDGSPVDPGYFKTTTNGTVNIIVGGPTTDYLNAGEAPNGQPFREPMQNATYNAADGTAVYTFTNAIPAAAKGTYTFSIETRRGYTLSPAPLKGPATVNEGAPNVPFNVAVTGTSVVPRRTLVQLSKCNTCHEDLYVLFSHGNQRIAIEHCVICHNPNGSDLGRRPADGSENPGESISFARMIHRIHTGDQLAQDFTVYGFGGSVNNFNDVTFPGNRRNCLKCHVSIESITPPLPITNQPVNTPRDFFSPRGSATSACTGCHDSRDVAAHAFINTAYFTGDKNAPAEACGTCHAKGADFDVAKVHAR